MVSDVPVGVLLSGGLDSSLIVALLAEADQHGLATFSVGFGDVGGREGNEFRYSQLVAERFGTDHLTFLVDEARMLPALDAAIGAMSEPMVSHDCVAFHLLSEEVAAPQGRPVRPGRRRGLRRLLLVRAARAGPAPAPRPTGPRSSTAPTRRWPRCSPTRTRTTSRARSSRSAFAGAATAVDGGLRLDTEVMLVDDPVKRVDNMTMAHGLEARTPFLDHELVELAARCPPRAQARRTAARGSSRRRRAGSSPTRSSTAPRATSPSPPCPTSRAACSTLAREALEGSALIRPEYRDRLLADPNGERTTLDGSKLWQLALLELWLSASCCRAWSACGRRRSRSAGRCSIQPPNRSQVSASSLVIR